jgi:[ribosomal protein S5]-alanine N-acetyltransferase
MGLFGLGFPDVQRRGNRVLIRPPRLTDFACWAELRAASRSFLEPWEPAWGEEALSRQRFRARLTEQGQTWRDDRGYAFFIFALADHGPATEGALVGGITLSAVRRGVAQMASVGYWTGAPFARKGYMREALGLTLEFAATDAGLHRVEAACLPRNIPSRALLLSSGFTEEGFAERYLKINSIWEDHCLFGKIIGE